MLMSIPFFFLFFLFSEQVRFYFYFLQIFLCWLSHDEQVYLSGNFFFVLNGAIFFFQFLVLNGAKNSL
jgi:hypothetical protein